MPKNSKHVPTKGRERLPPVSAIDKIPVAVPIASNGFFGYRGNPHGLHVAKSNAGRSAVHDREIKPGPIISTDLTLQDDATRLPIMTKRKASSIHVHNDSTPTAKRPKNKQNRPARSDTEDDPSNDEDRKPAAKDTTPTPDGVPSTCAGLKRKSASIRAGSVVSTRGQGIKREPTPQDRDCTCTCTYHYVHRPKWGFHTYGTCDQRSKPESYSHSAPESCKAHKSLVYCATAAANYPTTAAAVAAS
jgi:hypothetical protein